MYNVALCDDERIILDSLGKQLAKTAGNKLGKVFPFESVDGLIELIRQGDPEIDIVFLDIKIGESNGIDIASDLQEINPDLQIIFISGYDDYYINVYDVDHLFFLRKPIEADALAKALSRAEEKLSERSEKVFLIRSKRSSVNVGFCDIIFFEKDLRRIVLHSMNETYSFYGKFDDITPQLNEDFIRCHNSFVVNIDKVRCMEANILTMADGSKIPVSRKHVKETREAYLSYLERRLS